MNKLVLALAFSLAATAAGAQAVIKDTVSVGATYANQTWYSLANGVQKTAPRNEWDIAFDLKGRTSGLQINSAAGVTIVKHPTANPATDWGAADTVGIKTWTVRNNSDTSWDLGAVGAYTDPADGFDLDWGKYDMTTHIVTGKSIYFIRLANGEYRKFAIESLSGGVFTYKYSNLDGSGLQTKTLAKAMYPDKDFAYVNLRTGTAMDREPATGSWDLLFTQYTANLGTMFYGVTGILQARGVEAVKVANVTHVDTFRNWGAQTFSTKINTLGYDWKTFVSTSNTYTIAANQVYFLRTRSGEIWKVVPTGFGGSSTGNFMFSKQKLYPVSTGIDDAAAQFGFVVYPNPASGSDVQLIADLTGNTGNVRIDVIDMSGRRVRQVEAGKLNGLQRIVVPAANLASGTYLVRMNSGAGVAAQRLVIR